MSGEEKKPIEFNGEWVRDVAGSSATIEYGDNDVYFNSTDIPKKTLIEVAKYNKQFLEDGSKAMGEEAKKLMEEEKKVDNVKVKMPYGISSRGESTLIVDREKTYPGTQGRPDVTKSAVKHILKDPNSMVAKSVRKSISADLTDALLG
jgi:hypothetical protein